MSATPAEAGHEFEWADPYEKKRKVEVKPSCGGSNGMWYCITCDETLAHNFAKDSHIDRGEHVLAWICPEHGPEVP